MYKQWGLCGICDVQMERSVGNVSEYVDLFQRETGTLKDEGQEKTPVCGLHTLT